ncbi:MAG: phosphatase PAP2 family protein [bacterium]
MPSPIVDFLIQCDKTLFYILNNGTHNRLFDVVMPFLTDIDNWRIPLAVVWVGLLVFGGKKGRIVALLAGVCLALTDQLSSSLLKPYFARTRPCNALDHVRLLVSCTKAYSFPSSHATNIFAQATLFSFKYRKLTPILVLLALLVGFSRVYVGVHFPFDIIFGAVLGTVCAAVVLASEGLVARAVDKVRLRRQSILKRRN